MAESSGYKSSDDEDVKLWNKAVQQKVNPWESIQSKVIFVFSVFNFGMTCFLVGSDRRCWMLPYYYCIKFPILMLARYFVYRTRSWHWFLIEFCYFANLLLFLFLWFCYDNFDLFVTVFVVANGPLLHSVALLGNQLVFHSLDKWTSLHIHIAPALITYVIRWKLNDPTNAINLLQQNHYLDEYKNTWRFDQFPALAQNVWEDSNEFMKCFFYWPLLFVLFHQLWYYLVTCQFCYHILAKNPNAMTSFRFMFRKRTGSAYKLVGCLGENMRIYVFGAIFIMLAVVAFGPSILMWHSERFHLLYIIVIGCIGTYNGAGFYAYAYERKPKKKSK